MGIAQAAIPGRHSAPGTRYPESLATPIPTGRNRVGDEHDGDVRAAEKQRIMASAALSPVAPSSFLVRALCSEGEGSSDRALARLRRRCSRVPGGGGRGGIFEPRGSLARLEEGRTPRPRRIGREEVKEGKENLAGNGRGRAARGLGITLPYQARREGQVGRCSARVPQRPVVASRSPPPSPGAAGSAPPPRRPGNPLC